MNTALLVIAALFIFVGLPILFGSCINFGMGEPSRINKQKGFTLPELLITIVAIVGIIGYFLNVRDVVHTLSDPLTLLTVLRIVGIFVPPLGAILGFIS